MARKERNTRRRLPNVVKPVWLTATPNYEFLEVEWHLHWVETMRERGWNRDRQKIKKYTISTKCVQSGILNCKNTKSTVLLSRYKQKKNSDWRLMDFRLKDTNERRETRMKKEQNKVAIQTAWQNMNLILELRWRKLCCSSFKPDSPLWRRAECP